MLSMSQVISFGFAPPKTTLTNAIPKGFPFPEYATHDTWIKLPLRFQVMYEDDQIGGKHMLKKCMK